MYLAVNSLSFGSIRKESAQPHSHVQAQIEPLAQLFAIPSDGLYLFTHWLHKQ